MIMWNGKLCEAGTYERDFTLYGAHVMFALTSLPHTFPEKNINEQAKV